MEFPDYPLRGVYANNYVYEGVTGWEAFEPALGRAEQMDAHTIRQCAAGGPKSGMTETGSVWRGWWRHSTSDGLRSGSRSANFEDRTETRFRTGMNRPRILPCLSRHVMEAILTTSPQPSVGTKSSPHSLRQLPAICR